PQMRCYVNALRAQSPALFPYTTLFRSRARLAEHKPGEWITGRGWDHTLWPEQRFPTRQDLDAVSKDHPMIFGRVDGHVAVANSLDRKSTRLNSSHVAISYAGFCLKKKN